jgi:hypothetical protein
MQVRTILFLLLLSWFLGLRAHGQTRRLGSVTKVQNVACPSGFTAGSSCQLLTIHGCPSVKDLGVTTGMLAGKAGTIVVFGGGGGTRPTAGAFVTALSQYGLHGDRHGLGSGWMGYEPDSAEHPDLRVPWSDTVELPFVELRSPVLRAGVQRGQFRSGIRNVVVGAG